LGDQEPEDDGGAISGFFDDEESAVEEFFSPRTARPRLPARRVKKPKPTHYRVVSISLYTEDQKRLAALVAELKNRGYSRANRSLVIREALRQVDLDLVPPQR
jgi:hypothetical protein